MKNLKIIILALGIIFVLLVPLPSIQENTICRGCSIVETGSCPVCYQERNLVWNPPLIKMLLGSSDLKPERVDKKEGKLCGGFAGETGKFACPTGYNCKYSEPIYPDAQGRCVLNFNPFWK